MKMYIVIAIGLLLGGCGSLPRSAHYAQNTDLTFVWGQDQSKIASSPADHESEYHSFSGDLHTGKYQKTYLEKQEWWDKDGYHVKMVPRTYRYSYRSTNAPYRGQGYAPTTLAPVTYPIGEVRWPAPKGSR